MYLSQILLNPQRRATRDWLSSRQKLHAAVLAGFAPGLETSGRVLWRCDTGDHRLVLYVVSPSRPDFAHLVERGGWSTAPFDVAEYGPFLQRISVGQRYRFRLAANTVRSTKDGTKVGERGRLVAVGSRSAQEEWLLTRAASLGFAVPSDPGDLIGPSDEVIARRNLVLTGRETVQFRRSSDGTPRRITLATAQFDGVLEVTDADALRSTLALGVGRGKAYGYGLLTLAPET